MGYLHYKIFQILTMFIGRFLAYVVDSVNVACLFLNIKGDTHLKIICTLYNVYETIPKSVKNVLK